MTAGAAISGLALFLALTWLGNLVCRLLFRATGLAASVAGGDEGAGAGRVIGSLERLVLAIGVVTQSWPLFAAVIALKSVARFKELDDKTFAEYFLVGSLFSILWAVVVTAIWLRLDRLTGAGLAEIIMALLAP